MGLFGPGKLAFTGIMDLGHLPFPKTFRLVPMTPWQSQKISGTTKDSTGAALGSCVVDLFYTRDDTLAAKVTSDANGAFAFLIGPNLSCYIVAYKAGSPDVAGTTVNTLVGA